jgi:hypothetical protein
MSACISYDSSEYDGFMGGMTANNSQLFDVFFVLLSRLGELYRV